MSTSPYKWKIATTAAVLAGELLTSGSALAAIEQVVTTARKREESMQDVPVAAYSMSAQQLENYAVADLRDMGKMVPGLILERAFNGASATVFLRGVGTSAINVAFEQAVSFNVDNVAISKGRAIFDAQFDMAQIEVLRGPQALFFGKNSSAGVISVKTADPGDEPEYIARLGIDMVGVNPYAETVLSVPVTDDLGVRLALRGSRMFQGYFTNISEELSGVAHDRHTPKDRKLAGRLTVKYDPDSPFDFTLKVTGTDEKTNNSMAQNQIVLCPLGVPQPVLTKPSPLHDGCTFDKRQYTGNVRKEIADQIPWYPFEKGLYSNHQSILASAVANYALDEITLTSVTGFYTFDANHVGNFDGGVTQQIFGGEFTDYRSFTQEFRIASDFDFPVNFTAGVFIDDTHIDMSRPTRLFDELHIPLGDGSVFIIPHTPDSRSGREDDWDQHGATDGKTISVFGELTWDITDQLELSGGARWSHEKKVSTLGNAYVNDTFFLLAMRPEGDFIETLYKDDNVSPSVTLTWRPTDALTFFGAYKTGYKSGGTNLSELPQSVTVADDILFGAEKAAGGEIGAKALLFDSDLQLNVTAYRYGYKDLQVTIYNPEIIALQVDNAGKFYTTGLEIDAVWDVPTVDGLALRTGLAYNRAKYKEFLAPCYTGQTPSDGCDQNPSQTGPGAPTPGTAANPYNSQDMAGRQRSQAPEWMITFGGSYDFPIANGLMMGITSDNRFSSGYYWQETEAPHQRTKSHVILNASLRLYNADETWEVALIGKNLTDKMVGTMAVDLTGTGFGTGTPGGLVADTSMQHTLPREISLQATFRF